MDRELNEMALKYFRGLSEALLGISYEELREQAIKEGKVQSAEEFDRNFEQGIEDEPVYQEIRRRSMLRVVK